MDTSYTLLTLGGAMIAAGATALLEPNDAVAWVAVIIGLGVVIYALWRGAQERTRRLSVEYDKSYSPALRRILNRLGREYSESHESLGAAKDRLFSTVAGLNETPSLRTWTTLTGAAADIRDFLVKVLQGLEGDDADSVYEDRNTMNATYREWDWALAWHQWPEGHRWVDKQRKLNRRPFKLWTYLELANAQVEGMVLPDFYEQERLRNRWLTKN